MRKLIIYLTIITTVIAQPGLSLAAEDAATSASADSSLTVSQPVKEAPISLEAPVKSTETTLPLADTFAESSVIAEPEVPSYEAIVPLDGPATIDALNQGNLDNLQVEDDNLNNPRRDPGEDNGAYQQEKSALNNYKKEAGLTGNLRVDQFSGAASYNLGLEVPAGRSGLNPSLMLAYNSHDRSNDSWVGQGWNLELGLIQKSTRRGTNNLYISNEFTLSLGGSSKEIILIDEQNHLYAPKIESDYLKTQYFPDNSSWLVTDTQGIKYYFGQATSSRQDDPGDQNKIFKWQLDKIEDTNANFYRIEYVKRSGQIYPSRIIYTGNGQTDGVMEVLFNLEERGEDNLTSYQTQFLVTTDRRLNNIEVKVLGQTKLRYEFAYSAGQNSRTSLLNSITKKGYQNEQEFSLPTTSFTYSTKQTGWTDNTDHWQNLPAFNDPNNQNRAPVLVDFNGDSWVDIGGAFHNGSGFAGQQDWAFPNVGEGRQLFHVSIIGDVNGDKYPDFIINLPAGNGQRGQVYLNNGVNGFSFSREWSDALPGFIRDVGGRFEFVQMALVDVNGDGLSDIIYSYNENQSITRQIYLNTGNGWQGGYGVFPAPLAYCTPYQYPGCSSFGAQIVDVNGDGLPDVFRSGNVYLNTGSGFEQQPNQQWSITNFNLPQGMQGPWEKGGARLTDLNGDGLLDITIAASETLLRNYRWDTVEYFASWLNTGIGWQRDDHWNLPMVLQGLGLETPDWGIRMMDINNDNSIDVAKSYISQDGRNVERQVYVGTGTQANVLASITNGYGGQTSLEYQSSGRYFTEDNHFKNPHLPLNLETVKRITTTDGQGQSIVTDYDYQDGAYYADSTDYTLDQFSGFGLVTAITGNQAVKTYYHQGTGIDGYENGEYEDTIYKKGRVYREEVYQLTENEEPVLQSAKVNTWKQQNLDNNRKYVYLDGTVNYDYTQEGQERQQMAPGRDGLANQAVNQQAIQASEQAKVLSVQQLSQLQQAQTFSPTIEPQLVSQSADGSARTYYLGRNENGQQTFRYEVYNGGALQVEPRRDDNERGNEQFNNFDQGNPSADGYVAYNGVHGRQVDAWDVIRNSQQGNELNYRDNSATLWNSYGYISRVFLPFNTTPLPNDITITGASLTLYLRPGNSRPGAIIVQSNQHINQLQAEDYSTVGNVEGGSFWQADEGRYTTNLNATGRSWVNPNGWTKLALRGDSDFDNQRPPNDGRNRSTDVTMSEVNSNNPLPLLTVNYYYNNITPGIPTDLQVEDQVNPDNIANQQPHFSAIFNDENPDDQAIAYRVQVIRADNLFGDNEYDNFNNPLWDSGRVEFNEPAANGSRSSEVQFGNQLPLDGYQYFWRLKFWDNGDQVHSEGLWSDGQDYFYMDGSAAPVASVNLLTESRVEPRDLLNQQPSFSAIYIDPNPIDSAKWYQVQVDDNQDFSSPIWDSQKTELQRLIDNGSRSEEIQYGGEPLPYEGLTYYWRVKFWDDEEESGTEGAWSESAIFSMFNADDVLNGVQAKAAKFHYDFTTGNVLEEENLGTVSAAQNGVFLNIAEEVRGDEKNSVYDYAEPVNADLHILSAPKSKVILDPITQASTTVAITYDGLAYGRVEKANPTKEDLKLPQTVYEKTFNAYGLVTQTNDPLNHRVNISYDNQNYYPARITNHLYQITRTEYDLATGNLKKRTDPNGVVEEWSYDAFGRVLERRKSHPISAVQMMAMERYEYHDNDQPSWVKKTFLPGQNEERVSYSYFDGLGRTIQTREQSEIANQFRVSSVAYDDKGNVAKQSLVYFANGFTYQQEAWNTPYTQYSYDAQNRVLTEEFIGDQNTHFTTTYQYDGWNVTITDANNKQKKFYKDAYGQLVQTDEYLDDEIYSTNYEYNLLGKLTNITDSQSNIRNFIYDSLGRLTSQEEMHRADVQEFGVWSYEYDSASNLIQKTDPKGQVTTYTYDALNRILTENYQGQEGVEVSYTYDSGSYGKGRLARVVSSGAITNYTYDKWGRVTLENKTIAGRPYLTRWGYNNASLPTALTYPDNSKVYYSYNTNGLIARIRLAEPNQNIVSSMPFIDNVIYSPLKQIEEIRYTGGTVSRNTYDPAKAYRLTHKSTINGFNQTLQAIDYVYDNIGNIITLVDSSPTLLAKTTAYEYDDLYRLTRATVSNSANDADYEQTYAYDIVGNILNKSDIGDYTYQNSNPYQATRIANADYAYDQNGNLTSDGNKTYTYNCNDRLTRVDIDQNNILSNLYDQSGQRTVKQFRNAAINPLGGAGPVHLNTTIYSSNLYEEELSGQEGDEQNWITTKTRHITLGNQTIAHITINPQGQVEKAWIFTDHLGSASLLTDDFGRPKVLYDYYPFGSSRMEQYVNGGMRVAAYQYTGKEKDKEIGLYNYGARYYNAQAGRFTQTDPLSLKIAMSEEVKKVTGQGQQQLLQNPQVLNTYAYTANNPVKYTDPDGEFIFLAPLLYSAAVYVIANTTWDAINVGLSAYYFSKEQSSENVAYLAGDLTALSSPLFFGGFGAVKTAKNYNQNQQLNKLSQFPNQLIKGQKFHKEYFSLFRGEGFNAQLIKENGFPLQKNKFFTNSQALAENYRLGYSSMGNDSGLFESKLPRNVINDMLKQKQISFRDLEDPRFPHAQEIIIHDTNAIKIINQYLIK